MATVSCFKRKKCMEQSLLCSRLMICQFLNLKHYHRTKDYTDRATPISSFYNQSAIEQVARQPSVRLTPTTLLYAGKSPDNSHLLRSAQYLHKELPVRIAHRIRGFRGLPFIVGCNPTILKVHEMYIRAFYILHEHPPVVDFQSEKIYSNTLRTLLDDHSNVVTMLAEGFSECRKHIQEEEMIRLFLDRMLKSRLGIRLLVEHHLALHDEKANHVGIVDVNFSPRIFVEQCSESVRNLCLSKYGCSPAIRLNGHLHARFPYIPQPLEYILGEILKNAYRASVESHATNKDNIPDVIVTIANNDLDFIIRVADRGGGIPHNIVERVHNYNFSTSGDNSKKPEPEIGLFDEITNPCNRSGENPGTMHGYGFGLPSSITYADYLGGSLSMQTMQGIGTDVYLRLVHIDGTKESFRI
uniref:Protein-serine/threonine kinase n=1 Tax=Crassostrea virginica TaxID=6565 RepID=A0A8B8EQV6_CRAVI|nr:3-methyl-2-oxobutanoate dehydrogenase [lipoamide] kinase, mitochondrial-like [Crassostrea virginica]